MTIFGHTKDVARVCIGWANANVTMTWCQLSGKGDGSDIQKFVLDTSVKQPIAGPSTTIVCFELMLLALLTGSWCSRSELKDIYINIFGNGEKGLIAHGLGGGFTPWVSGKSEIPELGHLVFFDGLQHVAISTGQKHTDGGSQVVSFWLNGTGPVNGPRPNTPVMFDSIENLSKAYKTNYGTDTEIKTAKPTWR